MKNNSGKTGIMYKIMTKKINMIKLHEIKNPLFSFTSYEGIRERYFLTLSLLFDVTILCLCRLRFCLSPCLSLCGVIYYVCGRGLSRFRLIGQLPSPLACQIIGHATPTLSPARLHCTHFSSQCGLSVDQSLTTGSKGIYNPALSKHIAAPAFLHLLIVRDISISRGELCLVCCIQHLPPLPEPLKTLLYIENKVSYIGVALLE